MNGLFITFEGPDGSGKTTQIQQLSKTLINQGYDVVTTREPGGTRISDLIRNILLSTEYQEMQDQTEVLLYAASRAQHVHEIIIPALKENKIVLCDRYIDASMAYQSVGLGINQKTIKDINHFASSGLQPERTYMMDVSVKESQNRLLQRTSKQGEIILDRIEQKAHDYHKKVREGFLEIAKKNPQRVCLINANQPVDIISEEIVKDITSILADRNM
ncbi:dTMP kinase [Chengkuizengella axinellae]|uniref:Thymidylate kinase n=1 Tax=Chengkuizengella axinellae TaxID=3064388 RepID=A0ABT9J5M6_9BACL|nr:dTMP kinase [Chengkuizengella sp. 2205SS18-9]MDP5276925.1 dTMP kinase [Chengkuizengella sp. 2205SS18-9]